MQKNTKNFLITLLRSIVPFTIAYVFSIFIFRVIFGRYPVVDSAFLVGGISAMVLNVYRMTDITKEIVLENSLEYNTLIIKAAKSKRLKILKTSMISSM